MFRYAGYKDNNSSQSRGQDCRASHLYSCLWVTGQWECTLVSLAPATRGRVKGRADILFIRGKKCRAEESRCNEEYMSVSRMIELEVKCDVAKYERYARRVRNLSNQHWVWTVSRRVLANIFNMKSKQRIRGVTRNTCPFPDCSNSEWSVMLLVNEYHPEEWEIWSVNKGLEQPVAVCWPIYSWWERSIHGLVSVALVMICRLTIYYYTAPRTKDWWSVGPISLDKQHTRSQHAHGLPKRELKMWMLLVDHHCENCCDYLAVS